MSDQILKSVGWMLQVINTKYHGVFTHSFKVTLHGKCSGNELQQAKGKITKNFFLGEILVWNSFVSPGKVFSDYLPHSPSQTVAPFQFCEASNFLPYTKDICVPKSHECDTSKEKWFFFLCITPSICMWYSLKLSMFDAEFEKHTI